ncbi:MAG: 3-oxoacyl-ACP reductase FabG [Dehalococcoidia bacterium]|nr:3-oxoacyl-ACP reductase FabG [Dehalococcoidia bacterium]
MRVKDRIALVTGAAQGLGEGIALRLAQDGAKIAVVDVNLEGANQTVSKIQGLGSEAVAFNTNVADKAQVQALCEAIKAKWGRIDILVNNAGITRDAMLKNMTEEQWDAVLTVNLKAPFLLTQAAGKIMTEQKYGKIVNITSRAYLGNVGQSNYSASKGGLVSLTRTSALEFARFGINVNVIAPGPMNTPMVKTIPQDVFDRMLKSIPLGRIGEPADIANAVLFLASDEASFITGQTLFVCGGRSIGAALA